MEHDELLAELDEAMYHLDRICENYNDCHDCPLYAGHLRQCAADKVREVIKQEANV